VETSILIVGAGPVGLLMAIDLAQRGVDVIIVEQRAAGEAPSVKCNHVSSRTMEILRRLGLSRAVRAVGLPDDFPNDVVFRTRMTGIELTRIPIPCRRERYRSRSGPDTGWPTPEPPHRANQIFFEPIFLAHAQALPSVTILHAHQFETASEASDGVTAQVRDIASGKMRTIRARYLVGCDGGRSVVRKLIGGEMEGDAVIQRVQSTYIDAPDLIDRLGSPPAWMSYNYNPDRAGTVLAIDGRRRWLVHNYLLPEEVDFEAVDRDRAIRHILGVGPDFSYRIVSNEDWIGRRLVSSRFRRGRMFISGDAAHLWVPYAGYGMNAGIADGMNLSWLLAAVLQGWASEAILDAYEIERRPITDQVSRFAMGHAGGAIRERNTVPPEIEDPMPQGEAARRRVGEAAYALNVRQFACAGLNFGYYYEGSPIIAYDGEQAPAYSMYDYEPSTVPGCRLPHVHLADGRSLYDLMGPGFTLVQLNPAVDAAPLLTEARGRNIPVTLLPVDRELDGVPSVYPSLLLARADTHIVWRGTMLPDPKQLLDHVTGHA